MGKLKRLAIQLDNSWGVYYGSQMLSGQVEIVLKEPMKVQGKCEKKTKNFEKYLMNFLVIILLILSLCKFILWLDVYYQVVVRKHVL